MGCDKICQAKKKAKEAQSSATSKQGALTNAQKSRAASKGKTTVNNYSVEVVTVAKFLGIDGKKNALNINEMFTYLNMARKSPEILANATAKNLITPITAAFGVYKVLTVGKKIFMVVKPGVKIAMQINDIATFNFAALAEMIGDIAQMILQILVSLAPMFVELLKNIFLEIPLYTKVITNEQSAAMERLINYSQLNIQESISSVLTSAATSSSEFNSSTITCPRVLDALAIIEIVEAKINEVVANYIQNDPIPTLEDVMADIPDTSYDTVEELHQIIVDYVIAALECIKAMMLNKIVEEVDKESIDITQIPDVAILDAEDKLIIKDMMEGLLTVTKKIEIAEIEELLRREFSSSQTKPTSEDEKYSDTLYAEAIADNVIEYLRSLLRFAFTSFNASDGTGTPQIDLKVATDVTFGKELEKSFDSIEQTRQDVIVVAVAEELIQNNKLQIFDNIINSTYDVSFDPTDFANTLNECAIEDIETQFDTMKTGIISDNTTTINNATITDETTMNALVTQIYNDTVSDIIDYTITPDFTCGTDDSICDAITQFKSELVTLISANLNETGIDISTTEFPDYVDKKSLNDMLQIFTNEINKELIVALKEVILGDALPCKSCKPCETLNTELLAYTNKVVEDIKDQIIFNAGKYIRDAEWTWSDSATVKAAIISAMTTAVNANAGSVNLFDLLVFKLKQEEAELLESIRTIIKTS